MFINDKRLFTILKVILNFETFRLGFHILDPANNSYLQDL